MASILPVLHYEARHTHKDCKHLVSRKGDCFPVTSEDQFFEWLGYKARCRTMLLDEFIWEHYTHNQQRAAAGCLQALQWSFLFATSPEFIEKYGKALIDVKGTCQSPSAQKDAICVYCLLRPAT